MSKTREQKKKMKEAKEAAKKKGTKKKSSGHGRKPVCPDCKTKDVNVKGRGNTIRWWFCKNCKSFFHSLIKGVA